MTVESGACTGPRDSPKFRHWLDRSNGAARRPGCGRCALAGLIAASLPWSTTAPSIFVGAVAARGDAHHRLAGLWTRARTACLRPALHHPGCSRFSARCGRTAPGPTGLHAIKPVAKLVLIPGAALSLPADPNAAPGFASAFSSPARCLHVLLDRAARSPALKLTATASAGVPVKNYIDQSQEFTLCAFALALPALSFWRGGNMDRDGRLSCVDPAVPRQHGVRRLGPHGAVLHRGAAGLFAWRHSSRRAGLVLLAGAVVASALAWTASPYLRQRIARHRRGISGREDISGRLDRATPDLLAQVA